MVYILDIRLLYVSDYLLYLQYGAYQADKTGETGASDSQ